MPQGADLDDMQATRLLGHLADAAKPLELGELERMTAFAVASARSPGAGSHRRPARRRWAAAVVLAAAIVMIATGATAYVLTKDSPVPDALQSAINTAFAGQRCVQADEATSLIQDRLSGLGLSEWTVEARPGATGTRCVIAGLDPTHEVVVLLPVEAPDVVDAMRTAGDRLMSECLSEDEARAFVGSLLDGLGVTGWSITTDGPVALPAGDEGDAVRAHLAAGCTVWSTTATSWSTCASKVTFRRRQPAPNSRAFARLSAPAE